MGMKRERKAANLSAGLIAETAPPGKKVIIKEILNFLYVALSKNKQHNIKCGPCGRLFYVQNGR